MKPAIQAPETAADDVLIIPPHAYYSRDYAAAEFDRLWSKTWQWACRLEDIPNVGDFVTYDVAQESIIVIRVSASEIRGYYNVCAHRGRRLTSGSGTTKRFVCRFHGWQWNIDGTNAKVIDAEDWRGELKDRHLTMQQVKVDTWGGYVFINMDLSCEPLHQYLEPAVSLLAPFEIERMRYRWRKRVVAPCNWKVALEAFTESYHVLGTHPQLLKYNDDKLWSSAKGLHGHHGLLPQGWGMGAGSSKVFDKPREDVRQALADYMMELKTTLNAFISLGLVEAAQRLPHDLPPGLSSMEVITKMLEWGREIDARNGVIWPAVTPEQILAAGYDWHLFPNAAVLMGPVYVLGYRARPNGNDPNSCIFEVYTLDRAPEGKAPPPVPAWERGDDLSNEAFWGKILLQDFQNMAEVQRGVQSRGFRGMLPSPVQEQAVSNFHRALARYMGTGAPRKLTDV